MSPRRTISIISLIVLLAQFPANALYSSGDPNINKGQLMPLEHTVFLPTKKSLAPLENVENTVLAFDKKCIFFWCTNIISFKTKNNTFEFKFKETINYPVLQDMQMTTSDKKWKIESKIQSIFKSSHLEYNYTPESTKEICVRGHEYCQNSFDVDSEGKCQGNVIYECLEYKSEIIPESKACYLEKHYNSHIEMTIVDEHQKPVAHYKGNTFTAKDSVEVELSRCGAK